MEIIVRFVVGILDFITRKLFDGKVVSESFIEKIANIVDNTPNLVFVFGMIFLAFLPVFICVGCLLLYKLYSFLYKKFIRYRKIEEQTKQIKNERQEKWFYNLWLPIIIYVVLWFLWRFFYHFETLDYCVDFKNCVGVMGVEIISDGMMSNVFFWIFYPIYHLFYFAITRFISYKYFGSKIAFLIFLISIIMAPLFNWLHLFLWEWEIFPVLQYKLEYILTSTEEIERQKSLDKKYREEREKMDYEIYLEQKEECLKNIKHLGLPIVTQLELCDKNFDPNVGMLVAVPNENDSRKKE